MSKLAKEELKKNLILEVIDLIKTKQTKSANQHTKAVNEAIRKALDNLEN
ncbi:hypothetical protein N9L78_00785 [Gammaproteobacteria bacterium]|nr:hypothetical protein [Gammaproteobacteria bacterium]